MPAKLLGYQYVRYGIALAVYSVIAEQFDTTSSRVERTIRCAIEEAFNRITPDVLEKYFGNTISSSKGRPTKIAYISNQILVITNAEIRNKLSLGNESRGWFDFIPRANGNLSIKWRGPVM